MNLDNQIIFWVPYLGINVVSIILLYLYSTNKHKFRTFIKLALILNIIFFLLSWLGQILILYLVIRVLPFSQELLQGTNSFFIQRTIYISQSYLLTVIATCLIYIISIIILKYQKRPLIEDYIPKIMIILGISLNLINILPGIFLAFLMGLLFQTGSLLMHKPNKNLSITPFLLLALLVIRMLTLFPFYNNLLITLRLT